MSITDKKIGNFVDNCLLPYLRTEAYLRSLSDKKLVNIADKIIEGQLGMFSPSYAVYEEMKKRIMFGK